MGSSRLAALAHPVFTGAIALVVLNDHFLKERFPGVVTGKLSDIAGIVLLAWALGAVTRRPATSAVAVSLAFVVLKTVPGVAYVVAPALGGVTLRDPTDVVALVALLPTTWALQRVLGERAKPEPRGRELLRAVCIAGSTIFAALAVGATSCAGSPVVTELSSQGDVLWANAGGRWARSSDGGQTWTAAQSPKGADRAGERACGANPRDGCYWIGPDRAAVWFQPPGEDPAKEVYRVSGEHKAQVGLARDSCAERADLVILGSIVIVEDAVVVSAHSEGILRLGPDGRWEQRPVLDIEPVDRSWPVVVHGLSFLPFVLPVAAIVLVVVGRPSGAGRIAGVLAIGALGAFGLGLLGLFLSDMHWGPRSLVLGVGSVLLVLWSVQLSRVFRDRTEIGAGSSPTSYGEQR